jgi:HNH endonuclease
MSKDRSESNCLPHRKLVLSQKYIDSFWSKVEKTGENKCWKWKTYKNKQGYGRLGIAAGQCVNAHRVSWVIHNGQIPDGLFICHTCDNPECTNPKHLFLGTRQDNINDMMVKKRGRHFQKNSFYGVIEEKRYDGPNRKNRWRSFIVVDERVIKLGAHTSVLEAARNYDRIAGLKYGIKDKLNFPEEYDLK